MEKFAERIKELRQEKSLSQYQLSKLVNVHFKTVSRWENGSLMPSAESIISLADFFGVTADFLLGRTDY